VVLAVVSASVALAGILLATVFYLWRRRPAEEGGIWAALRGGYYLDDLYARVLVGGGGAVSRFAASTIDQKGVDGLVNGVGALTTLVGRKLRPLQSGFVRSHSLGLLVGAVALLVWFLSRGGF
jgi:NADH-quinone oxidoreductase subunit L